MAYRKTSKALSSVQASEGGIFVTETGCFLESLTLKGLSKGSGKTTVCCPLFMDNFFMGWKTNWLFKQPIPFTAFFSRDPQPKLDFSTWKTDFLINRTRI